MIIIIIIKKKAQRREKLLYLVNSWSSSAAGHVSAAPYLRRLRWDGEERRVKGADGYRVQAGAVREGGRTEWQGAGRRGGQRGERKRCSSSSCSLCYKHTQWDTRTHTEARVGAHRRGRHQYLQPVKKEESKESPARTHASALGGKAQITAHSPHGANHVPASCCSCDQSEPKQPFPLTSQYVQ